LGEPDISGTGDGEVGFAFLSWSYYIRFGASGYMALPAKETHFSYSRKEGVGRLLHKVVNLGKRKIGERRISWQNKT
jgi:hypothetical protein